MKRLGGASWKGLRRGGACEGARSLAGVARLPQRRKVCGFHKVVACTRRASPGGWHRSGKAASIRWVYASLPQIKNDTFTNLLWRIRMQKTATTLAHHPESPPVLTQNDMYDLYCVFQILCQFEKYEKSVQHEARQARAMKRASRVSLVSALSTAVQRYWVGSSARSVSASESQQSFFFHNRENTSH